ncbi:MAG: LysM peptidoglycan-binding domain-containing M23 family metallopeptidase [Chloroflexi bacterium]|nr:LysM peptidoglycan-binding domain-containing M23 family metallopeptidase [Chloroflexota bacterium]
MILGVAACLTLSNGAVHAQDVDSIVMTDAAAVPAGEDAPAEEPAAETTPAAAPAPETAAVPPAPTVPKTYTVQASDTMFSIAKRHGVSVDALLWANNLTDPNVIKQGQQLVIPPSTGKLHVAKDGDTLDSLAQTYSVSKTGIAAVNGLAEDATLKAGQRLLIPVKSGNGDPAFTPAPVAAASAEEPVPIPQIPTNAGTGSPTPPLISSIAPVIQVPGVMTAMGTPTVTVTNRKVPKLAWPVPNNPPKSGVSQGFRPGHTGIDIYTPEGTPIKAAAAGTVKMAAKNPDGFSGYGWIVIVDHGDGISTWYAHCGSFSVKDGDKVKAGDVLGAVGMTGRTTGPHLHFELRVSTSAVDPRLALP